jgi:hypothetical protein
MRFDDEDGELSFQVILAYFHPDNYVFDANEILKLTNIDSNKTGNYETNIAFFDNI